MGKITYNKAMKTIPLTKGYFAKVDNEDYVELSKHRWMADCGRNQPRAIRRRYVNGVAIKIVMSRLLTKAPLGLYVDHINGDTLDNQKSNLRVCTRQQNCFNRSINKKNKYGYKGIYPIGHEKWGAKIGINRKTIHLGSFKTKTEAAISYNKAAKKYFGEFARLNPVK